MLMPMLASAYDAQIDGIYYNFDQTTMTAEVTGNGYICYEGEVTIPSKVTYNDVTYSVTSIGNAFGSCSGLTSVTIPESVTSIGKRAFSRCSGLTSVTIPESVISIGDEAFYNCSGLTSVTIPNSMTTIGYSVFCGCSGLTSVTIPNSVKSIGRNAFDGWDLPEVISKIENPFNINGKSSGSGTFSLNTFNNATLYVPVGTIDKYKATEGWKDFAFIEEGNGSGNTPTEPKKCEKPEINVVDGKLEFSCATEDVKYHWTITNANGTSGEGNSVPFKQSFTVSVYATKDGYENSDLTTKEFSGSGLVGDVNCDGVVNAADAVKLVDIIMGKE